MNKVVNIHHGEKYDVYIGRPSPWGNPFVIPKDGTRDEVIQKYRDWLDGFFPELLPEKRTYILAHLEELREKRLGCFCSPKRCHGDILVELLEGL